MGSSKTTKKAEGCPNITLIWSAGWPPPRSIDPAHEMPLKKTLDALNLRRVVVDEKTGACEVSFAWTPRAFSPMGALWGTVQLAWGFALVHYIFYGLFAAIFIYAYGRHDWRVLAACVTVIAAYTPSFIDGSEFRLGRPWDALRTHPIWALSQAYFPARLVRTTPPIDPNKKYVFGWHPHGILILSRIHVYGGVWETLFPGVDIRVLGASPMFKLPGCREICLWMGAVDAGRRTAERVLKAGKSVVVYPGGSREIFDTDPNSSETRCHLTRRKGFVRLALKHGAELVPVFVFGEKTVLPQAERPGAVTRLAVATAEDPAHRVLGPVVHLVPAAVKADGCVWRSH